MARRRKRRGKPWIRLLLVSFLLLEGTYRAWLHWFASDRQYMRSMPFALVPPENRIYAAHPYTSYTLTEGYTSRDGKNRHNALGYRGKEVTREKAPGVFRILVLGGSTTYETSVEDWRLSTPEVLERILGERYGRSEVEVVNAGCGGWNSWESLVDLEFRGLALQPDLVVIYCGTNDVHTRFVPPARYRRDNTGFRKPWQEDSGWWHHSTVLHGIAVKLKLARRNSVAARTEVPEEEDEDEFDWEGSLDANPPTFFADNLDDMIVLSKSHGAAVLMVTFAWCGSKDDYASTPHYQRGFRETNAVIRAAAEKHQVPLFDYASVMPVDPSFWSDGRHVNEQGAQRKAELYAAFLAENCLPPGRPAR
jgi:lysophospholipase L1-like esterase